MTVKQQSILLLVLMLFALAGLGLAAELESRVLTHYVPQDLLENAVVRKEAWTEIKLNVAGGVRKGDTIRIWAGGSIDCGNGDQPGQYICGPSGQSETGLPPVTLERLALSPKAEHRLALLFKTETQGPVKALPPGKPLEIKVSKDQEKLWAGFNDEKGRYHDNHIGKGKRHAWDPLWIRIEVVRTIVD